MGNKLKCKTVLCSLLTTALLVGPISGSVALAIPTNAELKIGITQEFENFNPLISTMAATIYMSYLITRNFIYISPDGKWLPQLVKSIPSLENGEAKIIEKDGKKHLQVIWELIDNAKWGDGKPMTCDDLKFSWEVGLNENVSVGSRDAYQDILSINWDEKTPKKCVVLHNKIKWDFFRNMITPMPRHIEQAVMDKFGKQKQGYDHNSEYYKNPTNPGLYNGPYVVSELKLGSHIAFSPNPYFYGPQPKIKKVIFKLVTNTSTLEANLQSGTIDMVCPIGFAFDQALSFEKKIKADKLPFKILFKPGLTYEHIDFDMENPILKDIRVRQAMIYAINRQELTQALFEGKQKPAIHRIAPIDAWYTDDPKKIKLYPYLKRDASKLLREAGWKMEKDGFLHKDGQKLSLQFMTNAGDRARETVQVFLQSQWKAVGIEVLIKNEPARVFFGETAKKRKFGGLAMYAWTSAPEQNPRSGLHSTNIPSEKNSYSGQNLMAWVNHDVDTLIDQLDVEFNPKKRIEMIHKILKAYTEDAPVIPLYYRSEIAVIPSNLNGYKLAGHRSYETNEIETWDLGLNSK